MAIDGLARSRANFGGDVNFHRSEKSLGFEYRVALSKPTSVRSPESKLQI